MPTLHDEILLALYDGLYYLLNPYELYRGGWQYKVDSYYKTVERMEKKGLLTKHRKEKKIFLQLTDKGKTVVRDHRRAGRHSSRPWDEKWRLVIFDIPEKRSEARTSLRNYLKTLGFGKVQRSIWITPHDLQRPIDHFLLKLKISDYVYQVTVEQFRGLTDVELARTFWPIKTLHAEYQNLVKKYSGRLIQFQRMKSTKDSSNGDSSSLRNRFLGTLLWDYQTIAARDPQLPSELLPPDWGQKSWLEFIERAQRIFSAME